MTPNLVDAAKMEGKPKKKKWMKKAFAKVEAASESVSEVAGELAKGGMAHKGRSRVKAMYGSKKGKYYGV